jgi:hypothetical protein
MPRLLHSLLVIVEFFSAAFFLWPLRALGSAGRTLEPAREYSYDMDWMGAGTSQLSMKQEDDLW